MDDPWLVLYLVFLFLVGLLIAWAIITAIKKSKFKSNAKQIEVGMTKDQVIELMGPKFSKSVEENGNEIFEWVYRISGGGAYTNYNGVGMYSHTPGYAMSVAVKFSENKVIAVSTHNIA